MADNVTPKKRDRKPAPAIVIADAPAASRAVACAAAIASAPMVSPVALSAETVISDAAPLPAPEPMTAEPEPAPEPVLSQPVAATPTASAAAEPFLKGSTPMATTYDTAASTDKAKAMFGDFNARAKTAMEKSAKLGEEMTEFTKGNVEALVTSGRVAAKGAETIAQDVAESMKKQFEGATAQMKSLAGVKSPTELFQLQSDYAKTYFDGAVADASKFSESMMKLMGDIAQPLSSRYALAAEKFKASAL